MISIKIEYDGKWLVLWPLYDKRVIEEKINWLCKSKYKGNWLLENVKWFIQLLEYVQKIYLQIYIWWGYTRFFFSISACSFPLLILWWWYQIWLEGYLNKWKICTCYVLQAFLCLYQIGMCAKKNLCLAILRGIKHVCVIMYVQNIWECGT